MHLKDRLRNIHTDRANFANGLPSMWLLQRNHPMAQRCRRVGAVHSINSCPDTPKVQLPLDPLQRHRQTTRLVRFVPEGDLYPLILA